MTLQRKKEVGMIVFVFLYSLLFFFAAAVYLKVQPQNHAIVLLLLTFIALLWVAILAVAIALAQQPGSMAFLIITTSFALMVAGFMTQVFIPAIMAALIMAVALGISRLILRREMMNRVFFHVRHVFTHGARSITLGLIVAIAALAWPYVTKELIAPDKIGIPEEQIARLLRPVEPLLRNIIPGFQSTLTIDQIIAQQIGQEAATKLSPADLDLLRQEFGSRLNLGRNTLTGVETSATLVTNTVNLQLRALAERSPWLLTFIILLIIILAAHAIVPFIVWPILGLISGIVALLRQVGMIYLARSQATIERLHY